jgi:hypothetical protein
LSIWLSLVVVVDLLMAEVVLEDLEQEPDFRLLEEQPIPLQ